MKTRSSRGATVALLVCVSLPAVTPVGAADTLSCDRICLQGIAERYLSVLVAHDPSKASLAPDSRITENGQVLGTGHGLWKTATANSRFRLYFTDPEQGSVGFIGLLTENGSPVPVSLRLKVRNRQVTEAEAVVARNTSFANPAGFAAPVPVLVAPVKASDRSSREDMVRIADRYFTGLDTDHSGKNVPFDPAGTQVPGYGYLKYSGATRRPFDTLIPEVFKVRNGQIVEIEATMPSLPFGSQSGWD